LLRGESVRLSSEYPISGTAPDRVVLSDEDPDVVVGIHSFAGRALRLIVPCVTAGIGCRRGMDESSIDSAFRRALDEAGLVPECVAGAASVDLKKDEPGLVSFCGGRKLPFRTFPSETLEALPGAFTSSEFVRSVTGTDSVCERAAVAASGGELIFEKHAYNGVTVAFAAAPVDLTWE
nr:cobalamin biosynthesis protein [Oscillospiraceae bacterium]